MSKKKKKIFLIIKIKNQINEISRAKFKKKKIQYGSQRGMMMMTIQNTNNKKKTMMEKNKRKKKFTSLPDDEQT